MMLFYCDIEYIYLPIFCITILNAYFPAFCGNLINTIIQNFKPIFGRFLCLKLDNYHLIGVMPCWCWCGLFYSEKNIYKFNLNF